MRRFLLVPLAGLGFAAAVAVGSTAASTGEAKRTVSASGVIKVIRPGSITVHSAFDVTCRRTDASPDVSRFSPRDLVKIRCSGSVLRRIAPAPSPLARPSPPTTLGSDEHGATTTATAAGSITSLGSGSITVNVEHPLTCTVGAGSPALGDYHVGDVVRIGRAGGVLSVIVRKETSPSPTTTRPSETIEAAAGTNAYGNGAISSLATSSITVTGDGSITCRVADGSPRLAGYRVGDRVKFACRGGALSAIVRSDGTDEHLATTTTTTTTTGGTVAYANGTITSIGAGAITVTGDRSTTCTIGAGSPGLGDFHQVEAVRIYCADGVLTAIVRQTAPTTTTTTTPTTTTRPTTTTQSSANSSTESITAIAAGSITVTGDRSTTCAIGAGSPASATTVSATTCASTAPTACSRPSPGCRKTPACRPARGAYGSERDDRDARRNRARGRSGGRPRRPDRRRVGPRPFVPNDPDYPLNAAAARDLALPQAWALTRGSRSIVVAIVDTGLVADADLDVASSWCVAPRCTSAADENGHGTVMAHIVAGHVDNDLDGAGVCGRCRVMVVKVTDARGRFRSDALAAGIRGAVEQGARVINLSLGPDPGAPPAPAVNAAVASAIASGVPVVMAAGNAGRDSESANAMASSSPGAIRVANVVAGTRKLARNSNHGRWVDVAAPGTETSAVGAKTRSTDAGTSDSAAYTTGVVALMLSCNPRLTPAALKAALLRTGTPAAGLDVASGKVVNADAAVRAAGCR